MRRSKLLAAVVAASLSVSTMHSHAGIVTPVPTAVSMPTWFQVLGIGVLVCATGLISASWAKSVQQKKELTPQQAATCGFSYFFNPAP